MKITGRLTVWPSRALKQLDMTSSQITVPVGNYSDIDRDYGSLATYVADHALAVDGPTREYDVVGPNEIPDESLRRTKIGWPIFHIGGPPGRNLRRR